MKLTGAQILWEALVREGVTDVFGYPGGAILPAYDAMLQYPIRHILVRHEQGATHMADGYARATGKVGVAIATSGPGATNMVTGIATAMMDSSPIVCITGQVGSKLIGSDAFQETDITGITLPITKHNYLVTAPRTWRRRCARRSPSRAAAVPGPVLVDITKDAQQGSCEVDWDAAEPHLTEAYDDALPGDGDVRDAMALINAAERPLILAGHGVMLSGAERQIARARRARADSDRRHAARHRRRRRVASAEPRHDGHARRSVGEQRDSGSRSADRARHALRRPRHRQPQDLRAQREEDPRRHRSRRAEQERPRRRRDRQGSARRARRVAAARRSRAIARPWLAHIDELKGDTRRPRHPEPARRRASVCGARDQRHLAADEGQRDRRHRRRPASDVGSAVLQARSLALAHHVGRPRHDGLRAAGGDRREDRAVPTRRSGSSSATAASR